MLQSSAPGSALCAARGQAPARLERRTAVTQRGFRRGDQFLHTLSEVVIVPWFLLARVLARGGVIGGESAGATIQGSYLVRGAREGNHIMMAKGYETGFGYLRDVAIDQHLITRKRVNPRIEAAVHTAGFVLLLGVLIVVSVKDIIGKG